MNRRPPIHRENGVLNFLTYIYPFAATNIAPAHGGSNIDEMAEVEFGCFLLRS